MCGRFILGDYTWAEWFKIVDDFVNYDGPVKRDEPVNPSFNIKPTQQVNIAYVEHNELITSTARWWFVPHWHKGDVKDWKATTFNAKIETAFEKPTFRTAWKSNRCLIPATGYYEWTGEKSNKQPWYINLEQNIPVFFFAGVYSTLGDGRQTCTILTRAAEPEIVDLHPRMPVILSAEQTSRWLTNEDNDTQIIHDYGLGWTNRFLRTRVRPFGIKDDGPELIEPFEPDI